MGEPAPLVSTQLERLSCGHCGIVFAVPAFWLKGREDGVEGENSFYCPNGHCRVFRDNALVRARKELEQKEQQIAFLERSVKNRDGTIAAQRGQLTKIKNRIQNGVCPACQRSFQNLRRHMQTKHPQL